MTPAPTELTALLVAVSFAAGLNVYATLVCLGVLARIGVAPLPPGLHVLENRYVVAACGIMFAIEFLGDKIPAFDLIWNALHTFVRVPVAGLLAYQATSTLSPGKQFIAGLAGAAIAFLAHGGKTAARAAVTASPEPFSNMALSLGEDALAIFLVWFSTRHPYVAGIIAAILLIFIVTAIRWVLRALVSLFRGAEGAVAR